MSKRTEGQVFELTDEILEAAMLESKTLALQRKSLKEWKAEMDPTLGAWERQHQAEAAVRWAWHRHTKASTRFRQLCNFDQGFMAVARAEAQKRMETKE